jgi:hypothetical protein
MDGHLTHSGTTVLGLCLLLGGAAPACSPASTPTPGGSTTAVARTHVSVSGPYDLTVTLRSRARKQIVRLVAEGAGTRRVTVGRAARVRVRMHAALRPGAVVVRAVGSRRRPQVSITARRTSARRIGAFKRLVWSDEFNGRAMSPPDPTDWRHEVGDWGATNGELANTTASSSNARLDGRGHLAIIARRQTTTAPNGGVWPYTSARLTTRKRLSVTYGRIEARMKLPRGSGLWPAFWMLGDTFDSVGWPASGEIDVMESIGQRPFTVHGTLHGPKTGSKSAYALGNHVDSRSSLTDDFHTFGVIWRPGAITWMLDGVPYATLKPADLATGSIWRFDHPFHLVLNLGVGGDWPGAPESTTPFPASLRVDWVRVYA